MPRWAADGTLVPTCIFEAATLRQAVKPVCRCGHSTSFAPHGLWWHFYRHHWDDRLGPARKRFWCILCKSNQKLRVQPIRLELVRESDRDIALALPPEREWKRMVRAVR